mmetsp:Transcript_42903/g.59575  ORF Transcript_42903/g.59575 Transcript_42903/m.59575 type:complete len:266 (-) Transcript_42903:168-965(-)
MDELRQFFRLLLELAISHMKLLNQALILVLEVLRGSPLLTNLVLKLASLVSERVHLPLLLAKLALSFSHLLGLLLELLVTFGALRLEGTALASQLSFQVPCGLVAFPAKVILHQYVLLKPFRRGLQVQDSLVALCDVLLLARNLLFVATPQIAELALLLHQLLVALGQLAILLFQTDFRQLQLLLFLLHLLLLLLAHPLLKICLCKLNRLNQVSRLARGGAQKRVRTLTRYRRHGLRLHPAGLVRAIHGATQRGRRRILATGQVA